MQPNNLTDRSPIRRGLRSCAECRRRKVRCIYSPDSPNICKRCVKYNLECVDPSQQISDAGADDRRTLRERVSKLEQRLDELQNGSTSSDFPSVNNTRSSHDVLSSANRGSQYHDELEIDTARPMAPLIAVLQGSNLLSNPDRSDLPIFHSLYPSGGTSAGTGTDLNFSFEATKTLQTCDALRNALPPHGELISRLSNGGQWWDHWHQKTFGSTIQHETLTEYAARVYGDNNPTELGMLISAFARHTDIDALRYMSVIDQVVIGDDQYAGTLTGLILIAFQTKNYLDTGQPRRAFLCNRRGLNICQLMNLHRTYASTPQLSALWWTLFQGDRFLSILLGLPYGMRNDQFPVSVKSTGGAVAQPFVIRMGLMTGKVIDHTQTHPSPPFSKVIDLDDELESLAASKGQRWWDCSLPAGSHKVAEFRARIVEHCVFFLTRMYLHLPCVLKPQSSHLYNASRKTGLESARELVKRYHALRTPVNGEPVFDCKTLDFIGFMASVVLVVGNFQEHASGNSFISSDHQLANDTNSLLSQLAEEQNCNIAAQCHRALAGLIKICTTNNNNIESTPSKIAIPYFGTLHVTANTTSTRQSPSFYANTQAFENVEKYPAANLSETLETMAGTIGADLPTIDYQGLYSMDSNTNWMTDASGLYADSFGSMMDLDQSWDAFFYPGLEEN